MADMEVKPVVLTVKYVRLEPLSEAHVPGLTDAGASDESIWEHMLYGDIQTEADMLGWVHDILSRPDLPFAVVHLESGRVAGATRYLNIAPEHRGLEIGGTWYGQEFQRTVVNTECKYLLLQYAFETLGCIRVQFKTDLRNERSQRAIERIDGTKHARKPPLSFCDRRRNTTVRNARIGSTMSAPTGTRNTGEVDAWPSRPTEKSITGYARAFTIAGSDTAVGHCAAACRRVCRGQDGLLRAARNLQGCAQGAAEG